VGFATGVPDAAAAGVPTAPGLAVVSGTATVACAPGACGADTAGVGAAVGSATVKVVVLEYKRGGRMKGQFQQQLAGVPYEIVADRVK